MPDPWTTRIWREFHAGSLSRSARDVLLTLRTYRGHGGLICPSHATLAARVRCCVRTVQRALEAAQRLGLVAWTERRVRAGWRWLRTSNVYRLLLPDAPVRTTGHERRGGERKRKQRLVDALCVGAVVDAARVALAAVAQRRMTVVCRGKTGFTTQFTSATHGPTASKTTQDPV